jgi:hypothetical protein
MEQIKFKTALILLLFINFIFSVKYISRLTPNYVLVSILLSMVSILLWRNREQLKKINLKYFNSLTIVFIKIPIQTLNVDRWSVITSFWDNYFKGEYVYFAKSHMQNQPGPMPFYFILALPFYLVGELGYFSILGIIVFLFLLKYNLKPQYVQALYLLFMMSSTFYFWEVICRSNIFFNGSLILFSILFLFTSVKNKKSHLFCNAILIGLLLSTRNVFIIPYIIAFLYILKNEMIAVKNIILIGSLAFLAFTATFIPFIYNHFEEFKVMNPFIIQSSFLMPFGYSICCILLAFLSYFVVKKENDIYFYSGILLFITIVLHFVYTIQEFNFQRAFFNSLADISYFILCIPFLLYYVIINEIEDKTTL